MRWKVVPSKLKLIMLPLNFHGISLCFFCNDQHSRAPVIKFIGFLYFFQVKKIYIPQYYITLLNYNNHCTLKYLANPFYRVAELQAGFFPLKKLSLSVDSKKYVAQYHHAFGHSWYDFAGRSRGTIYPKN